MLKNRRCFSRAYPLHKSRSLRPEWMGRPKIRNRHWHDKDPLRHCRSPCHRSLTTELVGTWRWFQRDKHPNIGASSRRVGCDREDSADVYSWSWRISERNDVRIKKSCWINLCAFRDQPPHAVLKYEMQTRHTSRHVNGLKATRQHDRISSLSLMFLRHRRDRFLFPMTSNVYRTNFVLSDSILCFGFCSHSYSPNNASNVPFWIDRNFSVNRGPNSCNATFFSFLNKYMWWRKKMKSRWLWNVITCRPWYWGSWGNSEASRRPTRSPTRVLKLFKIISGRRVNFAHDLPRFERNCFERRALVRRNFIVGPSGKCET